MSTNQEIIKKENDEVVVVETVAEETTDIVELKPGALKNFKDDEQKEILRVASEIDVTKFEKIMSYGSIPLVKTFEQAGRVLKEFQGTSADQEVINLVVELAKKASDSQDDFNLVIREPGFIQKLLLKISASLKEKNDADVKYKAVSCYKLLEQLRDSCDAWLKSLADTHTKIIESAFSDRDNCYELEQYIVAGRIAEERIEQEVEAMKGEWESTGLTEAKLKYDAHKRGLENFKVTLINLEKSRASHVLSVGQLGLQVRANENIQLAVRGQKDHSMALASQQLRNAVFDKKNREALEGQKSITRLNDELMQKVAEGTALTAEESEQILLNGVYTTEAALKAVETVLQGCNAIVKAREEMLPKIEQEMEKVKDLVNELAPIVNDIKTSEGSDQNSKTTTSSSSINSSGLAF